MLEILTSNRLGLLQRLKIPRMMCHEKAAKNWARSRPQLMMCLAIHEFSNNWAKIAIESVIERCRPQLMMCLAKSFLFFASLSSGAIFGGLAASSHSKGNRVSS